MCSSSVLPNNLARMSVAAVLALVFCAVIFCCVVAKLLWSPRVRKPESVNYHFTRQCNYACGFCFHTAKTSFVLPEAEAKRGLKMLKKAGEI